MNNTLLSNIFGQSPVKPIQQHIAKAHQCATALLPFFEAVLADNWENAEKHQKMIYQLEEQADQLKKQVRLSLPRTLLMSVPRSDLLDIVTKQDKVANRAKDIAGIVLGRKMSIPKAMHESFLRYITRSIETSEQALKAMNQLDKIMEIGHKQELLVVESLIEELNNIESDTDILQIENRRILFLLEKELPPVDVIFLYKIIDWVGDLADRASRVGAYLQLLLAH